jgi:uncharacterized OB-fold protein
MTSPVKIWRNQKKLSKLIGKNGKIVSWTLIRIPPSGFENQAPYPVALIKLDDGDMIMAQVVDYSEKDLKFGQKVVTIIRRTMQAEGSDIIPYGIKVRPL